jgi:hypothetical protein
MRSALVVSLFLAAAFLSGCATPRQDYVKQHPEMTPEHRKILLAGRIKNGDPVAGMTRDEIRLVMGRDPDQFTTINGEEAWVWVNEKSVEISSTDDNNSGVKSDGSGRPSIGGKRHGDKKSGNSSGGKQNKTTVFLSGGHATRAEVGEGSL